MVVDKRANLPAKHQRSITVVYQETLIKPMRCNSMPKIKNLINQEDTGNSSCFWKFSYNVLGTSLDMSTKLKTFVFLEPSTFSSRCFSTQSLECVPKNTCHRYFCIISK